MKREALAIVWDIENVTPSINSTFMKGLLEYAHTIGRVTAAWVYGDWAREGLESTAHQLFEDSFEMIHIPRTHREHIDVILGSHILYLLNRAPHIHKLLLVSGAAQLAPALREIRSHDVETTIICDSKNADEDLLILADNFKDFRDLTIAPLEEDIQSTEKPTLSVEESFNLLREAILYIENEERNPTPEAVYVRLRLMNERFDEKRLGFDSWRSYLAEAERRDIVHTRFKERNLVLNLTPHARVPAEQALPTILAAFLKAVREAAEKTITSEGKKAKLQDVGTRLLKADLDYHQHGYSKLKKVADAAAKRGLVIVSLKGSDYLLDLTKKGREYLEALGTP
ncbi:MAG: NYN domain-containing protein [Spirochaetaceae bacterium]|nr:NYN domain-containing protein [Spirochaetia bacterium]MCF7951215.1 NYN domain-containing protein [Spirochaetaceae bacterium]